MFDTCFIQGLGIILVAQSIPFFFKSGEVKRKSSRYQAPLLNAPRLAQQHYCILSCTENSTAGEYTSSYRPTHCSYSSPCSTLSGQILGYVKAAILANSVFAKHVGMVTRRAPGKGYESFASFLLTQEGHRKSYLTFITHLAPTCSHSKRGNEDGSPLEKKFPAAETFYLVNTEPWDPATWASHLQILLFQSGSVPLCPQAGWDGENIKRLWTFKIKIVCEGALFQYSHPKLSWEKIHLLSVLAVWRWGLLLRSSFSCHLPLFLPSPLLCLEPSEQTQHPGPAQPGRGEDRRGAEFRAPDIAAGRFSTCPNVLRFTICSRRNNRGITTETATEGYS